jgi:DNA-binding response OmpR family regulator
MPKVSGLELRAAGMALRVIMATGTPSEEEFTRCLGLQLAATLIKPYTPVEFLETVKKVLARSSPS